MLLLLVQSKCGKTKKYNWREVVSGNNQLLRPSVRYIVCHAKYEFWLGTNSFQSELIHWLPLFDYDYYVKFTSFISANVICRRKKPLSLMLDLLFNLFLLLPLQNLGDHGKPCTYMQENLVSQITMNVSYAYCQFFRYYFMMYVIYILGD